MTYSLWYFVRSLIWGTNLEDENELDLAGDPEYQALLHCFQNTQSLIKSVPISDSLFHSRSMPLLTNSGTSSLPVLTPPFQKAPSELRAISPHTGHTRSSPQMCTASSRGGRREGNFTSHFYLYDSNLTHSKLNVAGQCWHIPLIPALWRLRQEDHCEFKAHLVHMVSSRPAKATGSWDPVSENKRTKIKLNKTTLNEELSAHQIGKY